MVKGEVMNNAIKIGVGAVILLAALFWLGGRKLSDLGGYFRASAERGRWSGLRRGFRTKSMIANWLTT